MKRAIEVEVAGQRLAIRSDEGPDYVHQLAALVDAQVEELLGGRPGGNRTRALALVAIQLADQLLREQDLHDRLRTALEGRLERVEGALAAHRRHLDAPSQARAEGTPSAPADPAEG